MSKFCGNCGAELNDDATFCGNCGWKSGDATKNEIKDAEDAPVQAADQASAETAPSDGKNPDKKKTAILIGGIAIVVIAAIVGFILLIGAIFGGGGAQGALNNYASAMQKPNTNNVKKIYPDEYWEAIVDAEGSEYNDEDEAIEDFVDNLTDAIEFMEEDYGDNIRISIKIDKERDAKASILNDVKDTLKDRYDIAKKDVKKMVKLDCTVTIKGSEDEDELSAEGYAIQIRNNWYIISEYGSLGSFDLD